MLLAPLSRVRDGAQVLDRQSLQELLGSLGHRMTRKQIDQALAQMDPREKDAVTKFKSNSE
eukprot:SAG31_NODE_15391_length_757_cov_1.484802_2_plen_61_part_00